MRRILPRHGPRIRGAFFSTIERHDMKSGKLAGGYGPTKRETSGLNLEKFSITQATGSREGKSSPHFKPIGSSSRPVASKVRIESSAPMNAQMIRPKNVIGN
jgi:hypothetical protein